MFGKASKPQNRIDSLIGGTTRIDLPNRHLEYALTWYGLALTLIGVYAAFVVSRLRHSSGE